MRLISPNGVPVDASEEAVEGLLAMGFTQVLPTPRKTATGRRAPAKRATAKKRG